MTTKTRNYKKIYAVVDKIDRGGKDVNEYIENAVMQVTNGRTNDKTKIDAVEYAHLMAFVESQPTPKKAKQHADGDKWRKRVMASIGGWLRLMKLEQSEAKIKEIAVKSAGITVNKGQTIDGAFNTITTTKLRAIYNEFLKLQQVAKSSKVLTSALNMPINLN